LAQSEQLEIISRLPVIQESDTSSLLPVPNYQPDRAIREAVLARPEDWHQTDDILTYTASNQLLVYLGDKHNPLPVEEALTAIRQFSASTVLTARIVLAIWQRRRYEQRLSKNGAAPMRLDEILSMRGMKKRSAPAYPGTDSDIRYSNGYKTEDKQAILADLAILQRCIVRGECTVFVKGKWQGLSVDDQYLHHSIVYRKFPTGGREIAGIFVTAGDWINVYEDNAALFLAAVEQKVFQLNPHQEQHELRLALYLTERWREQARKRNYADPISMQELLEASVIPIDRKHTYRFIPRIEDALHQLFAKGILGAEPQCITLIDRTQTRWTGDWLASLWILLPPEDIKQHYSTIAASSSSLPRASSRPAQ